MVGQNYSFSFDNHKGIKFPEQAYQISMLQDNKMILMVGLPELSSYNYDAINKKDSVGLVKEIYGHGSRVLKASDTPYTMSQLYHVSVSTKWRREQYDYYEVHVDLDQKGLKRIVRFDQDRKYAPERVQMSFEQMNNSYDPRRQSIFSIYSKELQKFRAFDHLVQETSADAVSFCFRQILKEKGENSPIPDERLMENIGAGRRIAYAMGYFMRLGLAAFAKFQNLEEDDLPEETIPLLTKMFSKVDQNGFSFATLQQTDTLRRSGESVDRCVSFTDLLRNPAALLNRFQINHFLKNGDVLFDEEQLRMTAALLNQNKETVFQRVHHWDKLELTFNQEMDNSSAVTAKKLVL